MGNDDSRASINSGHVRKQEDDGFIQRLPKEDGSKHPNPDECNGIDKPNKLDEAARKKLLADLLDGDPSELLLSIINVEQQEISKQWPGIMAGNRAGVVISCGLILACAGVFLGWMAHEKREGNA